MANRANTTTASLPICNRFSGLTGVFLTSGYKSSARDEEQTNNETENKSINGNEAKIKSKKQINEFVKGDVFKPKPYIRDDKYIINLPDEIKENLEKGIAVLRNGEKAPKWVKVNLEKGEIKLDKGFNRLQMLPVAEPSLNQKQRKKLGLTLKKADDGNVYFNKGKYIFYINNASKEFLVK